MGAGSVMHGNAEETNIKKLGGLRKEMPITWVTFLISTLAITGIAQTTMGELADGSLYATQPAQATALAQRSSEIDDALLAAMERWESLGAGAAEYPSSPITLVVGYGAGGGTDVCSRVLAMNETWWNGSTLSGAHDS